MIKIKDVICPKCGRLTLASAKGKRTCTNNECDFMLHVLNGKKKTFWDYIK